MAITNQSTVWTDITGREVITLIRGQGAPTAIANLIAGFTACGMKEYWVAVVNPVGAPPIAGQVYTAQDQAILNFTCADTTNASLIIPAPLASIFGADGRTVYQGGPIAPLVAACIGLLCSTTGSVAAQYASGYRKSKAP